MNGMERALRGPPRTTAPDGYPGLVAGVVRKYGDDQGGPSAP